MKKVTDINNYKYQTYLELCLSMIEDAYDDSLAGNYDLANSQLRDILETFDRLKNAPIKDHTKGNNDENHANHVIPFPQCH